MAIPHFIIHSGQHYSPNMDSQFFQDLNLRPPEYRLEGVAEKKTHGGQTAAMLEGIESVLMERRPQIFLVFGDTNTNLAGALAARKLNIALGHVEAGERSHDWFIPEEHNRVIIDHIAEYLFATNEKSKRNLLADGLPEGRIFVVGNPIMDASVQHLDIAKETSKALERYGLAADKYAIMTMHREENVDRQDKLKGALSGISEAAEIIGLPVLFLAHPRTLKRLQEFGLTDWGKSLPGIRLEEAIGYLDFLNLLANARLVFTDSGGVQQEACIQHVPCVTLLDPTPWPETVDIGANRLAACDPASIVAAMKDVLGQKKDWPMPFGDGRTGETIAEILAERLGLSADTH